MNYKKSDTRRLHKANLKKTAQATIAMTHTHTHLHQVIICGMIQINMMENPSGPGSGNDIYTEFMGLKWSQ